MAESSLVTYVMDGMRGRWEKPVKHADGFTAGIADISAWLPPAGNIWLELKAQPSWPVRAETPVTFEFDELQKAFLLARRGWLLCRVRRDYLLFDCGNAYRIVDTHVATKATLCAFARMWWVGSINWKEFAKCVGKRCV